MTQAPHQVSALPVSYDAFIRHGWYLVPINPGSKGPKSPNWNKKENCITNSNQLPHGFGVGLAHAYSGTCAVDIDDWHTASDYLSNVGISLQTLFDAQDAVTIDSSNKGHGKLLYAMPFGLVLNSKKLIATREGQKYNFLDFRCGTANGLTCQDVLPPHIHPVTLQPYQFGGRGHWSRLPTLPTELLSLWQSLLEADTTRSLKTDSKHDASWDDVKSALAVINPDCDREQWVHVAMALHHADPNVGYTVFDEWSAQGHKYKGSQDINHVWRSLKQDGNITLGTLFHLAQEAGWKRPLPDMSGLFSAVADPDNVINLVNLKVQPPTVPTELFPKVLAQRAEEVAEDVGCEPVIPLMAGLAAVCGAVDKRTRLHIGGSFKVPPILWIMTIGDPSVKKSPGANQMFAPLHTLEQADHDRYRIEHLIWRGKEAAHNAHEKSYLTHNEQATSTLTNNAPPAILALPPEPKSLLLKVSDSTSQKLVHLSQGRPRGFLIHLDEMKNWTDKINDARSTEDRGCWIQGFESGPYRMDRVGTGTIQTENIAFAIYGNLQPKVFEFNLSRMSDDGLLQRFIPISIRSDVAKKGKFTPVCLTTANEYADLINRIHGLPAREYTLSTDAFTIYDQFQDWYYALLNAEKMIQSTDTYLTALGKSEGTCARLALVFHLVESPHEAQVSADTMQRAVAAMKSFIVPSVRYAFNNSTDGLEEWIKNYVLQLAGERETITVSEIKRAARRQLEAMNLTNDYAIMQRIRITTDTLVQGGWLALIEDNHKTTNYVINKQLATVFADQRKAIIKAKLHVQETMIFRVEGLTNRPPRVIGHK